MKILSWNYMRLSRPVAIQNLRRLICATVNRLGFFLMSQVALIGFSGGLVLSWCPEVDLECFVTNKNIFAWCFSDPPYSPWILSCVYGPHNRREWLPFWDSFTSIGNLFEASWLCIGDFNSVLDQFEKLGGKPVSSSSHCPFRSSLTFLVWLT